MTSIELESVDKIYDPSGQAVQAVDDMNISIQDGEFLVFVGPSGCGKTTTLRMIAGLESVTSGSIVFGDEDVTDVRPRERGVAMVFQDYALYPHMTVRKNIGFGLRLSSDYSEQEIERRVEETAEMLGIEDLLGDRPGELSGGQQQRVALGRAIVRDPTVFLLDEPLSNLDAKLRDDMRKEILRLQRELDVTSVYVTHDQTEAMAMGDRIAVMNEGELQQVGPPEEVYLDPANEFVAGFLGSPSMNFLETSVESVDGTARFDGPGEFTYERSIDSLSATLEGYDRVTVGIRPEDVSIVESGGVPVEVTVVEAMGDENVVYLETGGVELTGRIDSHVRFSRGDRVRIDFAPDDLYLFEPETGEAIETKASRIVEYEDLQQADATNVG
ncbi:ABC transporter ATP-binding protein [Natronobacterium texcoconense]|uniref:ABC-type D-xylose/L-arabinose transporter n=1 Tax=Natronobacterium texcoconense TaxID=1095778 RepID=A0A1H1FRI3_NATTX|nr:ABC transporter ATP-binding protein [Natronobacterium texcoconense]SDR03490.1 carbohydrate ABC transporter ATP-binding protein, CUT1 family [Natronobacterium texcoconense]